MMSSYQHPTGDEDPIHIVRTIGRLAQMVLEIRDEYTKHAATTISTNWNAGSTRFRDSMTGYARFEQIRMQPDQPDNAALELDSRITYSA